MEPPEELMQAHLDSTYVALSSPATKPLRISEEDCEYYLETDFRPTWSVDYRGQDSQLSFCPFKNKL